MTYLYPSQGYGFTCRFSYRSIVVKCLRVRVRGCCYCHCCCCVNIMSLLSLLCQHCISVPLYCCGVGEGGGQGLSSSLLLLSVSPCPHIITKWVIGEGEGHCHYYYCLLSLPLHCCCCLHHCCHHCCVDVIICIAMPSCCHKVGEVRARGCHYGCC